MPDTVRHRCCQTLVVNRLEYTHPPETPAALGVQGALWLTMLLAPFQISMAKLLVDDSLLISTLPENVPEFKLIILLLFPVYQNGLYQRQIEKSGPSVI